MPNRILVAFASNAGSTAEVAQTVGAELALCGAAVDVRPITELGAVDLAAYRAVIVGAPMILGWHRGAARFVKAHRKELAQVPTAFFATAMSLTQTPEVVEGGEPGKVRLYLDPKLPKAPQTPGRLSLKERYATVRNYLRPMLNSARPVQPVSVAFFGGKLDFGRLKFLQMLFVMLIVGARPGDYRNWDAIRGWARELGGIMRVE